MLNSKSLRAYKGELDMILNKIKDNTDLVDEYLRFLSNSSNIDSKVTENLKEYYLDFENDMNILIKKSEIINKNFDQILNRRIKAETFADSVLSEFDVYNSKGGQY